MQIERNTVRITRTFVDFRTGGGLKRLVIGTLEEFSIIVMNLDKVCIWICR